jgi:hypothetical protein
MGRGFGIPATPDAERARAVAAECERLGYSSIWSNDIPNADGIATAGYLASSTENLRVCVGALPCDRRPAREVAQLVRTLEIPLERLVLGLGAGQSKRPLKTVAEAAGILRAELGPALTIGVAAMGPQMCRLAGRLGGLVLFNWMVPQRIVRASVLVTAGEAQREVPGKVERAAYIRVSLEPGGSGRVEAEAARYHRIPAYRRHFEAMGAPLVSVGVAGSAGEIPARLAAYDSVLDEAIVRALPALDTVESTLALAQAAAPTALGVGLPPPE